MLFERVDKGSTTRKGIIGLAIGAVASAVVAAVAYSKSNAEVSGNELINAAELINTAAIQEGVTDQELEFLAGVPRYNVNKQFIGNWAGIGEYMSFDINKMKVDDDDLSINNIRISIKDGAF